MLNSPHMSIRDMELVPLPQSCVTMLRVEVKGYWGRIIWSPSQLGLSLVRV